jgi:hypothetical protein
MYGVLLAAIAFNLYILWPEVSISVPPLNDNVLHLTNLGRIISAIAFNQSMSDHWLPSIGAGYPLFHYYQHLPYMLAALIEYVSIVFLRAAPLPSELLDWTRYLLLSLFPLSICWSMRRFGFDRLASALAALTASLIATQGLYGFDFNSYVWSGYGLYTQLWGMVLLPPTLAQGYAVLEEGRGYFWAVLLLAALLLSHLVLGYIALISLVLLALVIFFKHREQQIQMKAARQLMGRGTLLLALCAVVTAYFFIPFLTENSYLNRSVWEDPGKYNSYGAGWVLTALVGGELFDAGRFPSFTLLAALGLGVCLVHRREERYRIPPALFIVWLLLYFGRPTWGALLNLLPLSRDLQLHRFIAGIHLAGIFLIGIGLAAPWRWAIAHRDARYLLATALLTALLLYPVYRERVAYYEQNAAWMRESRQALALEQRDLTALVNTLAELPPGRVYAGLGGNWGREYKIGAIPVYALLVTNGLDTVGYLYHALSLNGDVQVLFNESRAEEYNLFNIRYVVAPVGQPFPAFVTPIRDFGRHRLYEVVTTGYFDLVDSPLAFTGEKEEWYPAASTWMQGSLPAAKLHPIIYFDRVGSETASAQPLLQASRIMPQQAIEQQPAPGRILSERIETERYQAEVMIERAAMVMLKSTYHPNWRAFVDGIEAAPVMLMPSYIGIPVTPGRHTIQLEYRPAPLRLYLQIAGLLTLAVVGLLEWKRTRLTSLTSYMHLDRLSRPMRFSAWSRAPWAARAGSSAALLQARPAVAKATVGFRLKLGIYLLFVAIYLFSSAGHFFSTDHVTVYRTTESMIETGSLAVPPINDTVLGQDGRYYAPFGLGQSLAIIPWYMAGKLVDVVSPPWLKQYFGGVELGMWGGTVPIFFVSLFNQCVMPLLALLVFLFCLRFGFTRRIAFLTTLVFGFSTMAWTQARDSFQHPLEALLLLLTIYILFANRDNVRYQHALLSGCVLAFGILTRINLLLVAPAIAVYLLGILATDQHSGVASNNETSGSEQPGFAGNRRQLVRQLWQTHANARTARYSVCFALPVIGVFALIMYLNYARFGNALLFNAPSQAKGFSTPLWLGLYGNLFSIGRSIFVYSPPTLLALFTFRKFYRSYRAEARLFLAVAVIYLMLYSTYGFWEGGWTWGPRFLFPIVPLLILSLGYGLAGGSNKAILALLVCLGIGIQILGVTINYSYVYWDWQRMNLVPENAYLFVPSISPIAMHARALTEGRYIDLWVVEVYRQFGLSVFVATILAPLSILASAIVLLRGELQAERNR